LIRCLKIGPPLGAETVPRWSGSSTGAAGCSARSLLRERNVSPVSTPADRARIGTRPCPSPSNPASERRAEQVRPSAAAEAVGAARRREFLSRPRRPAIVEPVPRISDTVIVSGSAAAAGASDHSRPTSRSGAVGDSGPEVCRCLTRAALSHGHSGTQEAARPCQRYACRSDRRIHFRVACNTSTGLNGGHGQERPVVRRAFSFRGEPSCLGWRGFGR